VTHLHDPPIGDVEAVVLTKAVLRAADSLNIPHRILTELFGLSEVLLSQMAVGQRILSRDERAFALSVQFVRVFRALNTLLGGDDATARAWMHNENSRLGGVPANLIQTEEGLKRVVAYLEVAVQPA
jgi:Protein of unknown function (DUF2384)